MAHLITSPGNRIRHLRKHLGLTLSDMSARTGMASSTLSKLENGNVSLSYDKLVLLSKGLGVEITELLADTPGGPAVLVDGGGAGGGRRIVQRAGEGQLVETRSYRHLYLATELLNKRFTPIVVELHARTLEDFKAEFGHLIRHPGEEFALVLEGEVAFHSEHYAPVLLRAGDSIFFDSDMGHAYLKASDDRCRLFAACTARSGRNETLATHLPTALQHAVAPSPPPAAKAARTVKAGAHASKPR